MDKAEVIVLEGALAFGGLRRCWLGATIEAFGLEDAPDAVAVEMRQEMGDDKRQVIEGEVAHPAQRADNGALRLGGLPGQVVRPRRMVQAVCRTPLAPLADGLGGHAIALGEDAAALMGAGDLGTGDGRGAGVRMDLQHRSDLPLSGLDQTFKQVAIRGNSMPHRVPTMFRNLTPHYLGTLSLSAGSHLSVVQLGTASTLPRDIDADLDQWLEPFLDATGRSTRRKMAPLYVRGLLGSGGRKSIQPMAERLGLSSHDPLHHFVSSPAWDDAPLWRVLAEQVNRQVGGAGAVLVVDASSIPKTGALSVGVARQYCGALGKVANCQVLVSLTLARGELPLPVGLRLFLPVAWTDAPERCEEAGVPETARTAQSKP